MASDRFMFIRDNDGYTYGEIEAALWGAMPDSLGATTEPIFGSFIRKGKKYMYILSLRRDSTNMASFLTNLIKANAGDNLLSPAYYMDTFIPAVNEESESRHLNTNIGLLYLFQGRRAVEVFLNKDCVAKYLSSISCDTYSGQSALALARDRYPGLDYGTLLEKAWECDAFIYGRPLIRRYPVIRIDSKSMQFLRKMNENASWEVAK